MESRKDLPVLGNNLGGQLAFRIFQFFERRNVSKSPDKEQQQDNQ